MSRLAIAAFLLLCVAAGSSPAWAPRVRADQTSNDFPGWGTLVPGGWTPLPLEPTEAAYAESFPGRVARFEKGNQQLVVRYIEQPSRRVHPSHHCLAASGYHVERASSQHDPDVGIWIATRGVQRMRVEEWFVSADGHKQGDVSAWYWSAVLGRSRGPWIAYTRSTPLLP